MMANVVLKLLSYWKIKTYNLPLLKNDYKALLVVVRNQTTSQTIVPDVFYFNNGFNDEEERKQLLLDMKIINDFITEDEENSFFEELEPYLKRMRYEKGHWDNAIKGYRETERQKWNAANSQILEKVKNIAFPPDSVPLKHVHVLDLEESGVIMPHIDSVKFCGTTIAGISLLTNAVMRLVHDKNKEKVVDVLLKRRSLYIMTGTARYDFTHEILGNENSRFKNVDVKKSRRISIICRNEP